MTVPRSRGRKSGIGEAGRFNEVGSYHLSKHHLKKAARRERRLSRNTRAKTATTRHNKNRFSGYKIETVMSDWFQPKRNDKEVLDSHIWKNLATRQVMWSATQPNSVEVSRVVSLAEKADLPVAVLERPKYVAPEE